MKQKRKTLSTGLVLLILGGAVIVLERITDWGVSEILGKLYCGDRYLQITCQPGDGMCGFNMDMVVGITSFLLIVIGLFLILIGNIKKVVKKKKNKSSI